jgi:hypothetical protein
MKNNICHTADIIKYLYNIQFILHKMLFVCSNNNYYNISTVFMSDDDTLLSSIYLITVIILKIKLSNLFI